MRKFKKRDFHVHPLMAFFLLIIGTIILSGFLRLLDTQATFDKINPITLVSIPKSEVITSLLSLSGLKYIFANTVANFANFTVLSNLIIILMGISIMDNSGFLQTTITLTTKKMSKKMVTFIFTLICMLSSIFGDLSYLVFIPLGALLFYYGKRNPAIGIISSFATLACGSGLNVLLSSIDSSILNFTQIVTSSINSNYIISRYAFLFIMIVAIILITYIITLVTENILVKKLPKYEFSERELEEDIVTKKEKKGMLFASISGIIYIIFFIYNIIPGLPLSGAFLDNSQNFYIDKLFSINSFFNHGFVFILTMLFIILGLFYGIGAGTIKKHHDFFNNFGNSLNDIGNILVMIFLASAFIAIFKHSNIGNVIVASIASIIHSCKFGGIPLIILVFILISIATLVMPSSISKWLILSTSVIPVMMKAGITPEFTQLIFRFAESTTMNITPLLPYFVVYFAFLEKYNKQEQKIRLLESIKYQIPYTIVIFLTFLIVLLLWYLIGLPLGIKSFPTI